LTVVERAAVHGFQDGFGGGAVATARVGHQQQDSLGHALPPSWVGLKNHAQVYHDFLTIYVSSHSLVE
jgi:hypothetical protein